jgi:hypothetical protein
MFASTDEVTNLRRVPPGIERQAPAPLPETFSVRTTLTLSSVGKAEMNGEACRWIEVKMVMRPEDLDPAGRIIILKLLIPERRFGAGDYPFRHVKKAYRLDSKWTEALDARRAKRIDDNAALLQYELDRFLPSLPAPAKEAKWFAGQEIETGVGRIAATRADFAASYQGKLTGGTAGTWTWRADYQVWLGPVSLFGIVGLDFRSTNSELDDEGDGVAMNVRRTLRLQSVGKGAVSELPNCQ